MNWKHAPGPPETWTSGIWKIEKRPHAHATRYLVLLDGHFFATRQELDAAMALAEN